MSLPIISANNCSPRVSSTPETSSLRQVAVIADRLAVPITYVALVAMWEGACRLFAIPAFLLPTPSSIVGSFGSLPMTAWLGHIWATLSVALIGYVMAIVISIPLAILLTRSRYLTRTMLPLLVVIQSTPIVAVAPIIVVVLGASSLPRILITFLISFFPIVVSSVTGLNAAPPELIELSRSLRAHPVREITQIRLPSALPYIFAALKISTTLSVIGAVVGEFVAAEKGLGYFILFSTSSLKTASAFLALCILVTISLSMFYLVAAIQRTFFAWTLRT